MQTSEKGITKTNIGDKETGKETEKTERDSRRQKNARGDRRRQETAGDKSR